MKDNAQSVASGALPKSGGTMTGSINMNNSPIYLTKDETTGGYYSIKLNQYTGHPRFEYRNTSNNPILTSTLEVADPVNAADAANKQYVDSKAGGIPSGVIAMWSGAANAIPAGWLLCNGSNGTPDLRNRFIVGAGSSYSVGATGGRESVTLTLEQMPSHSHAINVSNQSVFNWMPQGSNTTNIVMQLGSMGTSYSGNSQAHENRPPYYALCYIMKQ